MLREADNVVALDDLPDLRSRLARVNAMAKEIEHLPDDTYTPLGSFLADVEWFSLAAVIKSTSNAHAFIAMIESKNTIAASALVRMQIEAAMRLFGLTLVDDADDAGTRLMRGEKYSTLKMRNDGRRLADKILHEELSKLYAWVTRDYEAHSAYVHLDAINIDSRVTFLEQGGFFSLGGVDRVKPDSAYYGLVDTFFKSLRMTRDLLSDFLETRPKPSERAEILERFRREHWSDDVAP